MVVTRHEALIGVVAAAARFRDYIRLRASRCRVSLSGAEDEAMFDGSGGWPTATAGRCELLGDDFLGGLPAVEPGCSVSVLRPVVHVRQAPPLAIGPPD